MRKRRAIVYDDESVICLILRDFFESRGYDVLTFPEPVVCPIYHCSGSCANKAPCSDIMLTDFKMPGMNGVDLLKAQAGRGCKLTIRNKALVTGFIDDASAREVIALGAAVFNKPLLFDDLDRWVKACEGRMDLSLPLGLPRKEDRLDDSREITYTVTTPGDGPACRGSIVNLSKSGLCVRISSPLARQAAVTINTPLPIISPVAHVRWLEDAGGGAYFAGLQCDPPH